jgi:hypothetical protein
MMNSPEALDNSPRTVSLASLANSHRTLGAGGSNGNTLRRSHVSIRDEAQRLRQSKFERRLGLARDEPLHATRHVVFGRSLEEPGRDGSDGFTSFVVPSTSILARQEPGAIDRPLFQAGPTSSKRLTGSINGSPSSTSAAALHSSPSRAATPSTVLEGKSCNFAPPRPSSAISIYGAHRPVTVTLSGADATANAETAGRLGATVKCVPSRESRRDDVYGEPVRNGPAPITYTHTNPFVTYHGPYVDNVKCGVGRLTLRDGTSYVGEFDHGELTGNGIKTWPDGHTYRGAFVNGEPHGRGSYQEKASTYEGEFKFGQRHGHGTLRSPQVTYEGEFVSHLFDGYGVLKSAAKNVSGNFARGLLEGTARVTYSNGDTFVGDYHDDVEHGLGVFTSASTHVEYNGPMERGARASVPNSLVVRELRSLAADMVTGQPKAVPTSPRGRMRKFRGFAGALATFTPLQPRDVPALDFTPTNASSPLFRGGSVAPSAMMTPSPAALDLDVDVGSSSANSGDDDRHGADADADSTVVPTTDVDSRHGSPTTTRHGSVNFAASRRRSTLRTVASPGSPTGLLPHCASVAAAAVPVVPPDGNYNVALSWGRPFPLHQARRVELVCATAAIDHAVPVPPKWPVGSVVASMITDAAPTSKVGSMRSNVRGGHRGTASSVGGVTLSTVRFGAFARGDIQPNETGRGVSIELYSITARRKDCLGLAADIIRRSPVPLDNSHIHHPSEPRGQSSILATRVPLLDARSLESVCDIELSTQLLVNVGAAARRGGYSGHGVGSSTNTTESKKRPPFLVPSTEVAEAEHVVQAAMAAASAMTGHPVYEKKKPHASGSGSPVSPVTEHGKHATRCTSESAAMAAGPGLATAVAAAATQTIRATEGESPDHVSELCAPRLNGDAPTPRPSSSEAFASQHQHRLSLAFLGTSAPSPQAPQLVHDISRGRAVAVTEVLLGETEAGSCTFRFWVSPLAPVGEYLAVIRYQSNRVAVRPNHDAVDVESLPVLFPVVVCK